LILPFVFGDSSARLGSGRRESWLLDGFGQVPGVAGRERLELETAGLQSPFEQRVVPAAAPAGGR
jgi:hypothetical protein